MTFHFIITISYPVHNGVATATSHGNYVTKPGETRADVYNAIFNMLCDKHGRTNLNVMFFSLERDELSAA